MDKFTIKIRIFIFNFMEIISQFHEDFPAYFTHAVDLGNDSYPTGLFSSQTRPRSAVEGNESQRGTDI